MRIEQLLHLKDLNETNSITQTAQRFYMTQQGLSNSIRTLEKEYQSIFLKRSNHGVYLTSAGLHFLQQAEKLIHDYKELNEAFLYSKEEADKLTGHVRIVCHPRLLDSCLIDIIGLINTHYPHITLDVQEKSHDPVTLALINNQADIGLSIVARESRAVRENTAIQQLEQVLSFETLHTDSCVCCCRKTHPLADRTDLQFSDLEPYSIIHYSNRHESESAFLPQDEDVTKNTFVSNDIAFHKSVIKQGLAVALLSTFEYRKLYHQYNYLTSLPLNEAFSFIVFVVYRTHTAQSPALSKVLNMLRVYDFLQ